MAEVVLKKINKIYHGKTPAQRDWWQFWKPSQVPSQVHIVKDADLEIKDGEFLVLVGPSGCGKSTTLRMIAGLEEATSGEIFIGSRKVNDVSPKDRDIAMVFQSYALYPHMSVYDNMAFGLKLRKVPAAEIKTAVDGAAELLGLQSMLQRKPKELSGGQRQRVAMGRAIVRRPQVYLMDEPLSNLDAKLRVQMRAELQKLHRQLGVTTVYVTHDQTEAMTLGDRIVIMKDGYIQQIDTPLNLYERPANRYVAGFIGTPGMNFVDAKLDSSDAGPVLVASGFRAEVAPEHREALAQHMGKKLILGLRPQELHAETDMPEGALLEATAEVIEPLGSENYVYARVGQDQVVARVDAHTRVAVGDKIRFRFEPARLHIFDGESEMALCHSRSSQEKQS